MHRTASAAALLLALNLTDPLLAQDKHEYAIKGRVLDAKGHPVANIQVGTSWNFKKDSASPRWRSHRIRPSEANHQPTTFALRATAVVRLTTNSPPSRARLTERTDDDCENPKSE